MADAVSLKLPALWTDNIDAWFSQAEAQFALRGIKEDSTKFYYVVAALDSSTAKRVNATICNPPATDKYSTLKKLLLQKFGLIKYERAEAIARITGLGELKPSELMDKLLCILGGNPPDLMFRYHFLQCLPDYVRTTLSFSTEEDMLLLAQEADRIFAAGRPRDVFVQEASGRADVAVQDSTVDHVSRNQKRRERKRLSHKQSSGFCFYHARFGSKAHRCQEPCSWSSCQGNEQWDQQ